MPEAAMNEYDAAESWEHQIGRAGQVTSMKAESESHSMYNLANSNFRAGILALDVRHAETALMN